MENVIYNELRYRGYNVDVGVVDIRENINGSSERRQLEIDFVANQGNKRYYIQSAYDTPNEEKMKQETKSFDKVNDSFKKNNHCGQKHETTSQRKRLFDYRSERVFARPQ